ncbi:MAG: SUMF1/EgtB/PvdO family nonheme iron enzyme [Myxococcota bacterium]|nr:SUMF1/EgtB/PvdO family nonheme iron enzyme [Myxococcota bacterium]
MKTVAPESEDLSKSVSYGSYDKIKRIGSYRILGLLGKGGMGEVFRARHMEESWAKRQGGDVALKIMRPRFAKDPNFKERFIREGDVGKRIEHPNVARVHEVILDGETLGLVMELVDGKPLDEVIPKQGLSLKKAIQILEPLCNALDQLHAKGIVHRDLKPENIRIRSNLQPVVLDFGIAKSSELEDEGMTKTGVLMGTVTYMAPEQIDAKNVWPAADRYALGMIAYEMLCNRRPWEKDLSEGRIYTLKLQGNINQLHYVKPDLGKKISKAVMRMLAIRPEHRYPSCEAFVSTLKRGGEEKFDIQKANQLDQEDLANVRQQLNTLRALHDDLQLKIVEEQAKLSDIQKVRDNKMSQLEKKHQLDKREAEKDIHKIKSQIDKAVKGLVAEFDKKKAAKKNYIDDLRKDVARYSLQLREAKSELATSWNNFVSIFSSQKKKELQDAVNRAQSNLSDAKQRIDDANANYERDIRELERQEEEARNRFVRAGEAKIAELQSQVMKKVNQCNVVYNQQKDQLILAFDQQKKDLDVLILSYRTEQERVAVRLQALKDAYPEDLWIVKKKVEVERESFVMVKIESGSFMMGSDTQDAAAQSVEFPRHKVNLQKGFWMSSTPITQSLYERITRSNPSAKKHPQQPVESISWFDAVNFCNRLSIQQEIAPAYRIVQQKVFWDRSSGGYRLPTEAEWEYAARAGKETVFAGSDNPTEVAWFYDNSHGTPQQVAQRKPNSFGLHDMSGNVWEWCFDGSGAYPANIATDPIGDSNADKKIRRGGSWRNKITALRVTHRSHSKPSRISNACGFRIVRTVT